MIFVHNAWYATAYSAEIGEALLSRQICDVPLVLFRRSDGSVSALADMCWHRLLPLSKGSRVGDGIRCGYHGLVFDGSGQCTHLPGQDRIPPAARVAAYPVRERYGLVWVWLGAAAQSARTPLPELPWLDDPHWAGGGGRYHFACDYRLLLDNLLDLTHETFVHSSTIGNECVAASPIVVNAQEDTVVVKRWMLNHDPATFWKQSIQRACAYDGPCDRWQTIHYLAPSIVDIDVGVAKTGTGAPDGNRAAGISGRVINIITPETAATCHYFWGFYRDFTVQDADLTADITETIGKVFLEDKIILEAQQQRISQFPEKKLVVLGIDAGSVRMRLILDRLTRVEGAATLDVSAP